MLKAISFSVAAIAATVATGSAFAETISAFDLAQKGISLGAAGLNATYRGKTLTVTGNLERVFDVGHGKYVHINFQNPENSGWRVRCAIERSDTATQDRFALMAPGTPISATGRFKAAQDVFFIFDLEPCQMN
jgi:hypothetical protein